jgi:chromate reductase, NAD(P)H dehydrogenase (quinone)
MKNAPSLVMLSGSLRKDSLNKKIAKLAKNRAEEMGAKARFIDLADYSMPLFNEDIEQQGSPEALLRLREEFSGAVGLFIASPEYNGSFSAALKNTLDWLSRPADNQETSIFNQLTVALGATSPGALGGIRGLSQLRELMNNLGSIVLPQQLAIGSGYEAFSEQGALTNPVMQERLDMLIRSLVETSSLLNNN